MAVYRDLSNAERVRLAEWFFNEVYGPANPLGTLYFWSVLIRMHKPFCRCKEEGK